MKETEKQLRDIIKKNSEGEGEKNYSIVAGAGAGKTTLLSERISREIAEGIPIEKFAVITYTNPAATELREKILERLQEMKGEAEGKSATYIEDAIIRIEMMQISTIHSFLLRILKESAFEAGISLDAKMLEEDEVEARKKDFFEEWYRVHYPELEHIRKDWTIRSRVKNESSVDIRKHAGMKSRLGNQTDHSREVLENMFMNIAELRDEIVADKTHCDENVKNNAKNYIEIWRKPLEAWRDAVINGQKQGVEKPLKINNIPLEAVDFINSLATYDDYKEYISRAIEIITKLPSEEDCNLGAETQSAAIRKMAKDNPNLISIVSIDDYKNNLSEEYIEIWEQPLKEWSENVKKHNPLKKDGKNKRSLNKTPQSIRELIDGSAGKPSVDRAKDFSDALTRFEELKEDEKKGYYKVYNSQEEAVPAVDEQTNNIKELKNAHLWNYDTFCQGRRNQDLKDFFETWIEPLTKWADAVLECWPGDEKGKQRIDSQTREALDCIRAIQLRDVEIAKSYACALNIIVENPEQNIYNAKDNNAVEGEKYVNPAFKTIRDMTGKYTEWNFYKRYEDYISSVEKVIRVVETIIPVQKEYQEWIDNKSDELSNDDILYRSKELLQKYPHILKKVRNKFERLYVDEFQDTTKTQADIVKLLAEEESGVFKDNKLIIVGDPKQSIYRFAGAEKAVYDSFDKLIFDSENSERFVLKNNFRSNKRIVDWVNDSFKQLMPDDYEPMATDWEISDEETLYGVFEYDKEPEKVVAKYENLKTDADQKQAASEDDNSSEAESEDVVHAKEKYNAEKDAVAVAKLIRDLTEGGYLIEDRKTRESRAIKFSDFMVITKYTTDISVFVRVFAEHNIPVDVNGKFDISDNEVVQNFKALVDYFANHKDKRNELAALQAYAGIDITRCDDDERKKASSELKDIRKEIENKGLSPAGLMQYLVSHEELYVPKGIIINQNAVKEYRMHITQMVETCLKDEYGDLSEIAKCIERYMDINVSRGILLESDVNAVRLMNVHKAKGLTGNIVIIANRKDSEVPRYSAFKRDGKYYPVASYKDTDESSPNLFPSFAADEEIWELAREEEIAENIRLQYVAATRAANALIIMPCLDGKKPDGNKPWKELENPWFEWKKDNNDRINDKDEIVSWMEEHKQPSIVPSESNEDAVNRIKRIDLLENVATTDMDSLKEPRTVNVNPSGLETKGSTGYSTANAGYVRDLRPQGDVFGSVLHRVFELYINHILNFGHVSDEEKTRLFEEIVNRSIMDNEDKMRGGDDPNEIKGYLLDVLSDYSGRIIDPIIASADEIYPEFNFSFYINGDDRREFEDLFNSCLKDKDVTATFGEEYWVNGTTDLVIRKKDGGVKVFDYKSDARNGKSEKDFNTAVENKYKYQLLLYKYAMGRLFDVDMADVETEIIDLYR